MKRNIFTSIVLLVLAQISAGFSQNATHNYASSHRTDMQLNLSGPPPGQDSIKGMIYHDLNFNAEYDEGDSVYAGIKLQLYLDADSNGIINGQGGDSLVSTTTTSTDGSYAFEVNPELKSATPETLHISVTGTNDAFQESNTNTNVTNSRLEFKSGRPWAGFRFLNVGIPEGAYIDTAYIEFTSSNSISSDIDLELSIEDNVNPATFNTDKNNIYDRWDTSNVVSWYNVQATESEEVFYSPNIASLIQSVIDNPDWEAGKDLVFMIHWLDGGNRKIYSFEGDSLKSPRLKVEYKTSAFPAHYIVKTDESSIPEGTFIVNENRYTSTFTESFQTHENRDFRIADNSVLPVELTKFDVSAEGAAVQLFWETATEIDNDYFSIQRSKNVVQWEEIGMIEGHGNSTEIRRYSYTDRGLESGLYYYRLQQVNFDGTSEYSNVKVANISPAASVVNREIRIYPNPARVTGQLTIEGLTSEESQVSMYAMNGHRVADVQISPGGVMDLSEIQLHSGIYVLQVSSDTSSSSFQLVVNE